MVPDRVVSITIGVLQLVPENARAGRGGFPLQVRAGERQGLWIDVLVGRQLGAGEYRGIVTVTADGQHTRLPVVIEVLDVVLSDATLPAMVYYERTQTDLYHGRNMDGAYHRFARRPDRVHARVRPGRYARGGGAVRRQRVQSRGGLHGAR